MATSVEALWSLAGSPIGARLGAQATSRNRDTRARAIGRIDQSDHDAFESDNSAFYARPESLWALTAEYCREHRDQLRVTDQRTAAANE